MIARKNIVFFADMVLFPPSSSGAVRPYEGVLPLLSSLQSSKKNLYLVSERPAEDIAAIAARAGLSPFFNKICGARDDLFRTPDTNKGVDPSNTLFVGGTPKDVAAAAGSGYVVIAALWDGDAAARDLMEAGARYFAKDPQALPAVLRSHKLWKNLTPRLP